MCIDDMSLIANSLKENGVNITLKEISLIQYNVIIVYKFKLLTCILL